MSSSEQGQGQSAKLIDLSSLKVSKELLSSCIHCGLCLPACPTYLVSGLESQSPRGRILAVAKSAEEGSLSDRAAQHLSSCLGCLGCQTACPSGVHYEEILDSVRPQLAARRTPLLATLMRFSFAKVLPNYWLLRLLGYLLHFVQILGLTKLPYLLRAIFPDSFKVAVKVIAKLCDFVTFTPSMRLPRSLAKEIERTRKKSRSEKMPPLQFFRGCVMDVFYNHVNLDAVRVLASSHNLQLPKQTCCGALAHHAGDSDLAVKLAIANIESFQNTDGEIVVTSAGCGAMLKSYEHLLQGWQETALNEDLIERARLFAGRVRDFSEVYAASLKDSDADEFISGGRKKVAYHAACHLAHAQGVRSQPEAILDYLSKVGLIERVELENSEHCCGSAGIYNLINTETSLAVLDAKMDCLEKCGADVVVTANPGCLLQLEAGVKARRQNVKVMHLAEAAALKNSNPG
ncbi:MAG: (Fe-S)-binding protein [Candidatus Obscuribacterales bacterium]|nr:(Fe-S)-binding protein [Candidatus Obscuribacterales bacterium]